jgi:hypothetical protein
MSVSTRTVLVPSLAASLILMTPHAVPAQAVSSRPASVALTVVVPPRGLGNLTSVDAAVLHRTSSTLDLEAIIGVGHHPVSRIEVRLGAASVTDSTRVLVQSRSGEFQRLASDVPVTAAVAPVARDDARSRLRFRIESQQRPTSLVSVPIEYRVTVGEGDQVAVWTFPAFLEIGGKP